MDEKARPIDELIEAMRVAWAERDALAAKLEAARVVLRHRLTSERNALEAKLEAARDVVRSLEWVIEQNMDGDLDQCPKCWNPRCMGHTSDCALTVVLR